MNRRRLAGIGGVLSFGLSFGTSMACGSFSGELPASASDAQVDADATAVDGARSPSTLAGCSDGTREAFIKSEAGIAACEGAWSVAGVIAHSLPTCDRAGGNDGLVKDGRGCSTEDLCSGGWHVCVDAEDVATHGGDAEDEICRASERGGMTFYATAQSSAGNAVCGADGGASLNDVFGCGDTLVPVGACLSLNRLISVGMHPAGFGVGTDNERERKNVTKSAGPGGVLCCRD